ncbi:MAG TPA: VWA domain-containing protein [bacterium]|nr:VWA domain-containing protein [bacterium]
MIRVLQPSYCILLLLIPALWLTARNVRVLGQGRKTLVLLLRSLVLLSFILALAEVELVDKGNQLTVIFAIDRSASVPMDRQQFSLAYVQERLDEIPEGDRAGILFFGKEAMLQDNPQENVRLQEYQSILNTEGTDIEAAINLAMAAFPEGVQKRIVLITDGNQTQGDAEAAAQRAKANKIDLRIMPLEYAYSQEVLVEDLVIPAALREKEPFTIKVLVNAQEAGPGVLRVTENGQVIAEEKVELNPGKNAFKVSRSIEQAGVYTYEAVVEAENDRRPSNNRAQNFAFVKGLPRVLLVETELREGRFLAAALLAEGIQTDMRLPEEMPGTLRELQMYDGVILSNVPAADLARPQMQMLETAAGDLGIGLLMIGGPESFGAGGYQDSPVEKALPITMDVKQRRIIPSGALVLIAHSCEIPQGNYWAQEISLAALDTLSRNDYVGLLRFSPLLGGEGWLFPLEPAGNKRRQRQAIQYMTFNDIGDMPSFDTTLRMACDALKQTPANIKHIVILSDGDPAQPTQSLIEEIVENKITISTVCINPHSQRDVDVMQRLAQLGKGNFYHVKNNNNLPKIFTKEAMTVRRNMILEEPFTPVVTQRSEVLLGFDSGFPPLQGYVVTGPKAEAETVMVTHKQDPLLAHWRYGLGKTAAFTSDAKARWGREWLSWDQYAKFWSQLVRWTLRSGGQDTFQMQTTLEGDRVICTVDALTEEGEFLNDLTFSAAVIDPSLQTRTFEVRQTEPGRYVGTFPVSAAGSYLINMTYQGEGETEGYLTHGIAVPYSPEHNTTKQNDMVLKRLLAISGHPALTPETPVFEHNLDSTGDLLPLWPFLLGLAVFLFFGDIAARRVFFELPQLQRGLLQAWNWMRAPFIRKPVPVGPATQELGQLMQAKARAAEPAVMAGQPKETLIQRLDKVNAVEIAALEAQEAQIKKPGEATAPWHEVTRDEESQPFEDQPQDAYTSALFRAKSRAKGQFKGPRDNH